MKDLGLCFSCQQLGALIWCLLGRGWGGGVCGGKWGGGECVEGMGRRGVQLCDASSAFVWLFEIYSFMLKFM